MIAGESNLSASYVPEGASAPSLQFLGLRVGVKLEPSPNIVTCRDESWTEKAP